MAICNKTFFSNVKSELIETRSTELGYSDLSKEEWVERESTGNVGTKKQVEGLVLQYRIEATISGMWRNNGVTVLHKEE